MSMESRVVPAMSITRSVCALLLPVYRSVAVVVPLYTSSPIWVVLGSRLFLGHLETLTPRVILGVLTVFAGIVVITLFGG